MDNSTTTSGSTKNFLIGCALIALIKLWLLAPQEIVARSAPHDDTLFVGLALSILQGDWLGDYNQFTLIKGSGYPLFIAFSNVLNIPLIVSQELLYLGACLVFVLGMKRLNVRLAFLWVAFAVLAFNPFTYNFFPNVYPFRFEIYPAVSLLVFGLAQITFGRAVEGRTHWLLLLLLGVVLGWFWNIRGEAIWIAPTLGIFVLFYTIQQQHLNRGIRKFAAVSVSFRASLIVVAGFLTIHTAIAYVNYQRYGVFITNGMKSPSFESAYGGLLRIRTDRWERFIPVNRDAREIAYTVSPSFKQLEPYFESGRGTETWMKGFSDYPAAYFPWAFRDGLYHIGYFRDARRTHEFLSSIGAQIDSACQSSKIDCRPRYSNLAPTWHTEWNLLAGQTLFKTLARMVKFKGFIENGPRAGSIDDDKLVINYKYVTGSPVRPQRPDLLTRTPRFHTEKIRSRDKILRSIAWIYRRVPQVAFIFALGGLGFRAFQIARGSRISIWDALSFGLLAGLGSYAIILTILQITSYSQIGRQLNTTYPVILAFLLSVVSAIIHSRSRSDACGKSNL